MISQKSINMNNNAELLQPLQQSKPYFERRFNSIETPTKLNPLAPSVVSFSNSLYIDDFN